MDGGLSYLIRVDGRSIDIHTTYIRDQAAGPSNLKKPTQVLILLYNNGCGHDNDREWWALAIWQKD